MYDEPSPKRFLFEELLEVQKLYSLTLSRIPERIPIELLLTFLQFLEQCRKYLYVHVKKRSKTIEIS